MLSLSIEQNFDTRNDLSKIDLYIYFQRMIGNKKKENTAKNISYRWEGLF